MSAAESTVFRQAPTALLALVQHIHTHDLGLPLNLRTPSTVEPYFTVAVVSDTIDAWTRTGLHIDREETFELAGRFHGGRRERVAAYGRLDPLGLRVCITYVRRVPAPELVAVPTGQAS